MNFASLMTRLVRILGITIHVAVCWIGLVMAQANPTTISNGTEGTTYFVPRYVIGTGGVSGATGANFFHMATAGQTCAGGLQGAHNWLMSGFWVPGVYGPTEVHPEGTEIIPRTFQLHQNYPNPFNPTTDIRYEIPESRSPVHINLRVYNTLGQEVRMLVDEVISSGYYEVTWDGRDGFGNDVASGIYFYQVTASATGSGPERAATLFQQTGKMLFVK